MSLKFLPLAAAALLATTGSAFAQAAPDELNAKDVPTCSAAVTDHCISRPAAHHAANSARHARHHARHEARKARHHARHAAAKR